MKPASVSLFAFTLALSLGIALAPAKAAIQFQDQFPAQTEIDVRKVVPDHALNNHHGFVSAEVSRIDAEVLFESGSDKLTKAGTAQVAKAAALIKSSCSGKHVIVEGNTDSAGKASHNQDLSYRRALRVETTLVRKYGVPASQLSAKGYGSSMPVATNSTAQGRAANRRVTFSVVESGCSR